MNYTQSDIAALKAADVLHAYCERILGQGKRVGGKMFYPCPYGAHTRPKLEVTEKNGCGLALCRACNRGGSVFDVAAGVLGVDPRKDFAACVEAVAAAVGYNLTPDDGTAPKKARRSRKAGFSRPLAVPARPVPDAHSDEPLELLPPDEEAAALAMVERLRREPETIARFAAVLGLPMDTIRDHTNMDFALCGLLGRDRQGFPVYVYTHCPDADSVRVLGYKTRYRSFKDTSKSLPFWMHGKKQALWGAGEIEHRECVMITEGESDALAVRAAMRAWHDIALHTADNYNPDTFPAVVAKPDAGTFREAWARPLRGKEVTLITDADDAGQNGASKTADLLRAAGVRCVFAWMPSGAEVKDARAAFKAHMPHTLATDIYLNRITLD